MNPALSHLQSFDGFRKWSIAITLFLGTLSVGLSVTAVNIAIPTMMSSFGTSLNRIQWVLTGFMITRTVLIPCVGWLGDRLGDRNVFIVSTAIFTAGSLLCSLSWNTESLIFFRIIQGIGAGPLLGVAMAIMFEAFPRNERGLAMGLFMTGWSLGPFLGPILGGYLVEHVHWRAIFYINLPTGLLSIVAGYYILPRTQSHAAAAAPLDAFGLVTMIGATIALLLALSLGQEEGWGSRFIVGLFIAAAILTVLFLLAETRAKQPFLELGYFRNTNFSIANILIFLRVFAFRGASFLVSLFLQKALNYSPTQAGIFLLPGAVITGLWSPLAGSLSDRLGPRVPIVSGFVILFIAVYGLSTMTLWTTVTMIFVFLCLKSFGESSLNAPLNTLALGALPEGRARMGSGIIGMSRGLGEAFGVGVFSFLLERYAYMNLYSIPPLQGAAFVTSERFEALAHIRGLLVQAGQFGLAVEERAESLLAHTLITQALARAYQDLFFLIALIYVGLIAIAFFFRTNKRETQSEIRQLGD
ncbi:MAG: DHA2 family efflux MFS transporter permease subunit [Deltaproteobacteria bacterium]|nr:DHA2 family efflux MFS transporter permease subunit [Deltaproteobacteria bacterium]